MPKHTGDRNECRSEAIALLHTVGVDKRYQQQRPEELPFGVQRLLSIAVAYRGDAEALLLDEPAAGLSEPEMLDLLNVVQTLKQAGVAIVLVEHNMAMVRACADRVLAMGAGHALAMGTPEQIWSNEEVQRAYLG